jgi:hypothetical protein
MAFRYEKKASLFVDLETLGKWDDAVILSCGITVLLDDETSNPGMTYAGMVKRSLEIKLDVRDQVARGRKVEPGVMAWWKEQGESAAKVLKASPEDLPIHKLFDSIEAFLKRFGLNWKTVRIFDRNAFDMKKLQHVFEVTIDGGRFPPWDYQEVWGIETLLKFMSPEASRYGSILPKDFKDPEFIYHNAACDAALDAFRYYKLFQEN